MPHYLILFKNRQFDVVEGDSIYLHSSHLAVYFYGEGQDPSGECCTAKFPREVIQGYKVVSGEDAARYRLLADLQLARAPENAQEWAEEAEKGEAHGQPRVPVSV